MSAGSEDAGRLGVLVHGTAISVGPRGVLIRGRSGAGKSDLALRALCSGPGVASGETVRLVSDDQVLMTRGGRGVFMAAPPAIRGKLEVRGVGLVDLRGAVLTDEPVRLVLVVDLAEDGGHIERLPEPTSVTLLGTEVAGLRLYPFEASAPEKLRIAAELVPL